MVPGAGGVEMLNSTSLAVSRLSAAVSVGIPQAAMVESSFSELALEGDACYCSLPIMVCCPRSCFGGVGYNVSV